jgi:uncharacterized membrane protein
MPGTATQMEHSTSARQYRARATNGTPTNKTYDRVISGLGWFSLGLGLAEVVTPGAVARLIGVRNDTKTRSVLRGYGVREITAGLGILSQTRPAGWLWGRVAGDAVDLASLASAFSSSANNKTRVTMATAAVAGITAMDVICGQRLSAAQTNGHKEKETTIKRTIVVDRSPDDAYRFWRNFENLPTFMTYLESVRITGDRRSHWIATGPAGLTIEWDAELTDDQPGRLVAWRSLPDTTFENAGVVRFEKAPGNRGTLVQLEMDYAPNGGTLNVTVGKILGGDIGRRIAHDLRNFKQVLEIGEVTESDASIHPGMHAAQPAGQPA